MVTAAADGTLLPVYVVYKSGKIWTTWTEGGPEKTVYANTLSGWFDTNCFEDYFFKIALPYFKTLKGKKVMIGDNLSSHLNGAVLEQCEKHGISFVALPPNTTHITQPLDVAFFRPFKVQWRKIIRRFKANKGRKETGLAKEKFPALLCKLMEKIQANSETIVHCAGRLPQSRDLPS